VSAPPHSQGCTFHDDCPDDAETFDDVASLRAEIERLRESLAIYVHAHRTGNAVPPSIESAAVKLLGSGIAAAGVEVSDE
jgi:hypothetical protein